MSRFSNLSKLLETHRDVADGKQAETEVDLRKIQVKPQVRTSISEDSIKELAESILAQGLIQPIVVRPIEDDRYELVAGERRYRAVTSLGHAKIRAVIRHLTDAEAVLVQVTENIQRENLTVLDEAYAYQKLKDTFAISISELAKGLGKPMSHISTMLSLVNAPDCILDLVRDGVLRDKDTIYQLHLLNKESPEECAKLCATIDPEQGITRKAARDALASVRTLKELQQAPRATASPSEDKGKVPLKMGGRARSELPIIRVRVAGESQIRTGVLDLTRIPPSPEQVWVTFDEGMRTICFAGDIEVVGFHFRAESEKDQPFKEGE